MHILFSCLCKRCIVLDCKESQSVEERVSHNNKSTKNENNKAKRDKVEKVMFVNV